MRTIRALGQELRSGRLSCVELVRETLARIGREDRCNTFITLAPERALAEAETLDRELAAGYDRGPLHGIPVAYKDIIHTEGLRTTGGSLLFRDFVPEQSAPVVVRLTDAGAITIGKTNLHELAYGATSRNPHYGFVKNPRNEACMAGGSSGGSAAAVAYGFVPLALGTDTGGSIRIPASFCGVTGFKPTYGAVSRRRVMPLAFSLDHVGPMGTCADDCRIAMETLARRWHPSGLSSLKALRVGVPENFLFDRVDGEVEAAVRSAAVNMADAGAEVEPVAVPDLGEANVAARVIQFAEVTALYGRETNASLFGADVWALLQQGKRIAGHEYVNAQRVRSEFRRSFDALWKRFDVLVTPATPMAAPGVDEMEVRIGGQAEDTRMAATRLLRWVNLIGEPAIALPCGLTAGKLPIGLQLIAAPGDDARLLRVAGLLEELLSPGA